FASTLTSGAPFGTGAMALGGGGILQFSPSDSTTVASGSGATCSFGPGAGTVQVGGTASYVVTLGGNTDTKTPNMVRASAGSLAIAPGGGMAALGDTRNIEVAGTSGNLPAITNGIVAPYIIGVDNDDFGSGGFLAYDLTRGFVPATLTSSSQVGIGKVPSNAIYEVVNPQMIADNANVQVAALEMDGGEIDGNRGNLLVGSQQGGDVAGLIMNGGSIYAATLAFGAAEGVIYTNDGSLSTSINSMIIGSGGLTTFGPGALV